MKRLVLCLAIIGSIQHMTEAQEIYTNAANGATITLTQNLSVTNNLNNSGEAIGITFANGIGSGELAGSGNFSVYNIATTNQGGSAVLHGVLANSVVVTQYTGNITVINDKSSYSDLSSTSTSASAEANGISRNFPNSFFGSINSTAIAGSATATNGNAFASASARGILNGIIGNYSNSIFSTATAGSAIATNGTGIVEAAANGISGDLIGDLTGSISAASTGGTAVATSYSSASAEAIGVTGDLSGSLVGTISSLAKGGSAEATVSSNATASASATGIAGSLTGDVFGDIISTAFGGSATASNGNATANTSAIGIGNLTGNLSGMISSTAIGGTSISSNGNAEAMTSSTGISGNFSGNFSGVTVSTAVGGTSISSNGTAQTVAYGINGSSVRIDSYTGDIVATAIAGREIVNGVTNISLVNAYGISAEQSLHLNAPTGLIHAMVISPPSEPLPAGSGAYAIFGGTGNDTLEFGNVAIIGDIDLRNGINEIMIYGKPVVAGDVTATGGQNIYHFKLLDGANSLNPLLAVDGSLFATNGDTIFASAAAGQSGNGIIGSSYEVITATTGIVGTVTANPQSLFTLGIITSPTNVIITPTGLRPQTGENTPTGSSVAQTAAASATAVLADLSRHTGVVRSMLRSDAVPTGAPGPNGFIQQRLTTGEWKAYVRQINHLGEQDSDGSIAGYDWKSYGFVLGADRLVREGLVFGLAAGGTWSTLEGKLAAGGGNSDMFMGSLYGNWFSDTWYAELGLAYAHAWNDTERNAFDGRNSADFESDLFGGWLESGYTFLYKEDTQIEPYARTAYIQGEHDGYTDKGVSAPLTVGSSSSENWLAELGIRGKRDLVINKELIGLTLKAGWRTELLDNSIDADGRLFNVKVPVNSPEADSDAFVLGVKIDMNIDKNLQLGLEYEPVISGNWFYHNISGELTYRF